MKHRLFVTTLVLAMFAGFAGFAQESGSMPEKAPRQMRFAQHDKQGLNHERFLTDEQKEAFKTIRMNSMKEAKPLQDELRELKAHHQTLMTAEKPDMKAINASIDKMSSVEAELEKVKAKARVEMQSSLTDEQKMKMHQFMKMKKHGPKKQGAHHPGPGEKAKFQHDRGGQF